MRERHPLAMLAVLLGLAATLLPGALNTVMLAPEMQRLGLPASAAGIFTTSFQLGALLAALPLAALAGRLGARRCFLAALAGLGLLALPAALPLALWPLLGLRLAQGAAFALLAASGLALLRLRFDEARLGLALGLGSLATALATLLLPWLCGLLLGQAGPAAMLLPGLLLLLAAWALAWHALPGEDSSAPPPPYDIAGALLGLLCTGLLVAALQLSLVRGRLALLLLVLGLVALALWLWQQAERRRRGRPPLLPLDLLARPGPGWALAAALCGGLGVVVSELALISRLLELGQRDPATLGGLLALATLAGAAAALGGGWAAPRLPRGLPPLAGALLLALSLLALALLPEATPTPLLALLLAGLGAGRGLFELGNLLALLGTVPRARSAAAIGLLLLARGLAFLLLPLAIGLLPRLILGTPLVAVPMHHLWLLLAALAMALAALLSLPARRALPPPG
ncbi:MFS transporter [Pseudoroseomonas cervicalis]|uniref:MFS transporter n=1 Tax=Teichococcus cervicalis TaxID=204525 RepID=UPI0022F152A4|nr:MFS transporter [Pseudoroseomonas cervicalis]WBV45286.1 MFS transporter [Pseudoroseomonas cervicalis]